MEMNGNSLAWSPAHLQHSPGGQHVSHLSSQGITGQQMSYGCGPESMAMYELSQMDIKPDINQLQAHQQHLSNISPGLDTVGRIYDYSPYQHAQMIGGSIHSPMSAIGAQGNGYANLMSPNSLQHMGMGMGHPKHICQICGDRASGKHYGVYSCEGCKGFFKRTVRKDLHYTCRDENNCTVDKRQRNRCQHCRYMKCLHQGMKREAVQEERQKNRDSEAADESHEPDTTDTTYMDMPVEQILEAELIVEPKLESFTESSNDAVTDICQAADKQLFTLVEWARRIPHFVELPVEDQAKLIRAGWNELLIAAFSHRSVGCDDGILLATGLHVRKEAAQKAGVGILFDRVLNELVGKMRDMKIDKSELGCLRAIVLFNPDVKNLSSPEGVQALRETVYATLKDHVQRTYPAETGRFAKLLLRLPALRSIGMKAIDHLTFLKLIGEAPREEFLLEMLESPSQLVE